MTAKNTIYAERNFAVSVSFGGGSVMTLGFMSGTEAFYQEWQQLTQQHICRSVVCMRRRLHRVIRINKSYLN